MSENGFSKSYSYPAEAVQIGKLLREFQDDLAQAAGTHDGEISQFDSARIERNQMARLLEVVANLEVRIGEIEKKLEV